MFLEGALTMPIAKGVSSILKTEADTKYREESEDGASFVYTKWSPNNYRFIFVVENQLTAVPFVGEKKRTGSFCDEYCYTALLSERASVVSTLLQLDDTKSAGRLNILGGLESIVIMSNDSKALQVESKYAKMLTKDKTVLKQRYPRLRNICLIADCDFDAALSSYMSAIESNRSGVDIAGITAALPTSVKLTVDCENPNWFKAGVKNADNRNPLWYAMDADDASLHKAYTAIYNKINKEVTAEKTSNSLDSAASKNAQALSDFYTAVAPAMKNWYIILAARIAAENALLYGYTYDIKKRASHYILNTYYNQDISVTLFNNDARHNEKLSDFMSNIDIAYLRQLALRLPDNKYELYDLLSTFDFIFVYLSNNYSWSQMIDGGTPITHQSSVYGISSYFDILYPKLSTANPIKYSNTQDKAMWAKHAKMATRSIRYTVPTSVTPNPCENKSKLSVTEQLNRLEQIIRLLFRVETVSNYALFVETMRFWHVDKDVDADMIKMLRNRQCSSIQESCFCPTDTGISNCMTALFDKPDFTKGSPSMHELYQDACSLHVFDKTDMTDYFARDYSHITGNLQILYNFYFFLAKGYKSTIDREGKTNG
jgi:hypothetical protein